MPGRSLLFAAFLVLMTSAAFGLDASFDLALADKYYHRFFSETSAARFQYDAGLTQELFSILSVTGILWASHRFDLPNSNFTVPEELDYQGYISYETGSFSAGLNANLYTMRKTSGELGLFFDYYISPGPDFLNITLGAAAYWDFKGFYEELKLEPSLSLPLGKGISLSVPVILGIAENGFNGLTNNGLTGLTLGPKLTLLATDEFGASLAGGYFFSFNNEAPAYFFISLTAGFHFSAKE